MLADREDNARLNEMYSDVCTINISGVRRPETSQIVFKGKALNWRNEAKHKYSY